MANARVKTVTIKSIMKSSAFVKGFSDKLRGKPFDADLYKEDARLQWRYERGRQFACIYTGSIKNGRELDADAYRCFVKVMNDRTIA